MLAFRGEFPIAVASALRRQGCAVMGVGIKHMTSIRFAKAVRRCRWVSWGQMEGVITILEQERIRQLVMAGKIDKEELLDRRGMDRTFLNVLDQASALQDTKILEAVMNLFGSRGIRMVPPDRYTASLLVGSGVLTKRGPSESEWQDLRYGVSVAKHLARLEIGQTAVVKDGCVVAVEGAEGTDRAIRRAGTLVQRGVVVKVARPRQLMDMDPPAIGLKTLSAMRRAGCYCLGVESESSVMLDRERFLKQANAWNMAVVGLTPKEIHEL